MDAFYILQKAVDLIPLPFPGAGVIWTLAPASRAYSNLSANQTGQDFTAVLLGDISGNWSASPVAASVGTPAGALSLYLRGGRPDAAGFVTASLYLSSSETPVYSIDIALAGVTPPAGGVVLVRLSFRGGQRGQTSAVATQRAQINEVDVSGSAQAGQITLDTPPLTDLRAAVTTAGIHLTWGHVGSDAHHYEVWRATNLPHFVPPQGAPIAPNAAPSTDPSYDDGYSGTGNTAVNSFYLVRSVDAAGRPAPTCNRVGVFNFALKPGGS